MPGRAVEPATLDEVSPRIETLANGLRVVVARLPWAHRVALVGNLRVGSRYETEKDNGVSHLLEHMLYRGIPGYPTAHDQALAFERLGGTLTAATGSDSGSLSVACPKESFAATLALFASVYREPLLDGLDVEKRIVREEILEDLDEDGTLVDDYDLLRSVAFAGHPLGFPVIGNVRRIDALSAPDLRRHHEKHYVGRGTVLSVAGPLDPEDVIGEIERRFATLGAGDAIPVVAPRAQDGPKLRFVASSSSQTSVRVGFRGAGVADPHEPATELVVRLLDDGNSTRLYTRLCDERGLAYDVSAGYEAADDVGLLDVGCDVAHREATTVLREVLEIVKRFRDEGPDTDELAKAKARHRWSLEEMLDSPGACADFYADSVLRGYAKSLVERRDRLEATTAADVRAAARALFTRENLSVVVVGVQPKRAQREIEALVDGFR